MAIVKPLIPIDIEIEQENPAIEVEIDSPPLGEAIVVEEGDGSITVDFGDPEDEDGIETAHGDNLAEVMDSADLQSMAADLIEKFEADRQTRRDWAVAYIKGLDLLGMKIENRTQPWDGASGVFHPMMMEAAVRFQAQAMGELYPASGPARTKIVGKITTEKFDQANRVQNELNYLITEKMTDYREETEQLLFRLSLAGSAFKKVYFDTSTGLPRSVFVPAEDFVVEYGSSNLEDCERYTHVMRKTENEIAKLQAAGLYRSVELPTPASEVDAISAKMDDLKGEREPFLEDGRHVLLEVHADLILPKPFADDEEIALPYVITIDKSSQIILSIYRNWAEDDPLRRKVMHFVHYPYLPGLGFYGIGLIHLIGGLTKSATSIIRQLIDAGTLANLPAGLKARGLRIKGDNSPLRPGEFRDVDVPGGAIRDAITFLPYKEPSNVLYQLLGNVVEEGRRMASVSDIKISDMSAQAPVGTTLALLERNLKVMSGIQARLHNSMRKELRLIAKIIHDHMPEAYDYEVGDFSRREDFDGRIDIIPVSDPNAATMAQRVVQYQAALQLAQQAPQLYDMGKLHRQMLEVLGIQDAGDIIKLPDDIKPKDPVSENMAILKQEPVKAFMYQDHEAHIQAHMAAMEDPKLQQIVGQSPFAGAIQAAMAAHITEHVAMQYRKEIERSLGVPLPSEDEVMPEDVELEVSRLTAMAAAKLLQKNQAEAAALEAQQQMEDPLTQIQLRELAIKEAKVKNDAEIKRLELDLERAKLEENSEIQRERIAAETKRAGAQLGVRIATQLDQDAVKQRTEGARLGIEVAKTLAQMEVQKTQLRNNKDGN